MTNGEQLNLSTLSPVDISILLIRHVVHQNSTIREQTTESHLWRKQWSDACGEWRATLLHLAAFDVREASKGPAGFSGAAIIVLPRPCLL